MLPVAKGLPVSESLFSIAAELDDPRLDLERAAQVTRDAAASIEYHLDTLARDLGERGLDSRLRWRTATLESALREALLDAWGAETDMRAGAMPLHRLQRLSRTLRRVAEDEIDLVFEDLRDVVGMD